MRVQTSMMGLQTEAGCPGGTSRCTAEGDEDARAAEKTSTEGVSESWL